MAHFYACEQRRSRNKTELGPADVVACLRRVLEGIIHRGNSRTERQNHGGLPKNPALEAMKRFWPMELT